MSSIFLEIDCKTNPLSSFWGPPETFTTEDITKNLLLCTDLQLLNQKNQWKVRKFILTPTSLYSCKKGTSIPKKMTIIKWKKVEAFTETSPTEERFGFKLGHSEKFLDFYTENVEILNTWLLSLSKVAIMTDFEDDFAVIKEIDSGNYASVYLVEDLDTSQKYAVKKISKKNVMKSSRGPTAVVSEIEIMRFLDHPMIVKLYKVYENEESISLVLDYVGGGNLYQRIQKCQKFSEEVAQTFIKNMLDVFSYLHSLNVVHRDLKPENILMVSNSNNCEFKICDFGLACIAGDDQVLRCGSPGYVAPEILLKKPYNNKVDIFSAGIILFIILSGRAPFYGKNTNEILLKNRECHLVFHEKYWAHISKECVQFVKRLTEADPNKRISAEEALREPWVAGTCQKLDFMQQGDSKLGEKSPDVGGSFSLFKKMNDKGEVGTGTVFGNLETKSS